MVLNHLAAILFFSGPLFWLGIVMAAVPGDVARLIPGRRPRIAPFVRWAGLGLALIAIAI